MKEKKENGQWETVYGKRAARPDWITDDLILQTRRVFQKNDEALLTESELIGMIVGVGFLIDSRGKKS